MVHITNGEAVAEQLRRWSGEPRLIIWQDALHEGRVPAGLPLEELSAVRAQFWGGSAVRDFAERDRQMRRLVPRDALWLWFEDDLYDQLQLLQILDFLLAEGLTGDQIFVIDIPRGLQVDQMAGCAAAKQAVIAAAFVLAAQAWAAFTSADPEAVPALLNTDLSLLRHLRPALERMLEHYPQPPDGLNRVERTIVRLLQDGGRTAGDLFVRYQPTEERPFLGDTTFFAYLDGLAPLVQKRPDGIYEGHAGLAKAPADRWVGGRRFGN